jgi:hypothetical protein
MITREESDQTAAALTAAVTAAASSDNSVSVSRTGMTQQQNQAALDSHNKYRGWHQVGPLAWNDVVAAAAMDYASKCIWKHDHDTSYGENLYATDDKDGDLTTYLQYAVDGWVSGFGVCITAMYTNPLCSVYSCWLAAMAVLKSCAVQLPTIMFCARLQQRHNKQLCSAYHSRNFDVAQICLLQVLPCAMVIRASSSIYEP